MDNFGRGAVPHIQRKRERRRNAYARGIVYVCVCARARVCVCVYTRHVHTTRERRNRESQAVHASFARFLRLTSSLAAGSLSSGACSPVAAGMAAALLLRSAWEKRSERGGGRWSGVNGQVDVVVSGPQQQRQQRLWLAHGGRASDILFFLQCGRLLQRKRRRKRRTGGRKRRGGKDGRSLAHLFFFNPSPILRWMQAHMHTLAHTHTHTHTHLILKRPLGAL